MSACCPSPRASFLSSFQLSSFGGCALGSAAVGRRPSESADPTGPACGGREELKGISAGNSLKTLPGACGQIVQGFKLFSFSRRNGIVGLFLLLNDEISKISFSNSFELL